MSALQSDKIAVGLQEAKTLEVRLPKAPDLYQTPDPPKLLDVFLAHTASRLW